MSTRQWQSAQQTAAEQWALAMNNAKRDATLASRPSCPVAERESYAASSRAWVTIAAEFRAMATIDRPNRTGTP